MKQKYSVINRFEMMGYEVQLTKNGIIVYFRTDDFEFAKMISNEELETKFVIESYVLEVNKMLKEVFSNEDL